jgi:hypothetical protein
LYPSTSSFDKLRRIDYFDKRFRQAQEDSCGFITNDKSGRQALCGVRTFNDLVHRNRQVAFIVDAIAILHHKHLWRFMVYFKNFSYPVGQASIGNKIQEIKINITGLFYLLKPLQGYCRDRAAGAVFENYLGSILRIADDLFQLLFIGKMNPMHTQQI